MAPEVNGQPGWPFAWRLASETLLVDGSLARQLAGSLALVAIGFALLAGCLVWPRARRVLLVAALVVVLAAPWPSPSLILTAAYPTSFHRSPSRFDTASIEAGLGLYQRHCAGCHGADGKGEGPLAPALVMWPPRLTAEFLARRADGELFWHILHGMRDRHGAPTMPGFAEQLDSAQAWSILDALDALAAGTGVREEGAWLRPVRAPDAQVRCPASGISQALSRLRGQRVRLVAATRGVPMPQEDPRLVTIALVPDGEANAVRADCRIEGDQAFKVFALLAGSEPAQFPGTQLIIDRAGWLRARSPPGANGWSRNDLLCRAVTAIQQPGRVRDGLGDLISAMDAEPVRLSRSGPAH